MDFSETIAACDMKVGRYRQLFEIMKAYMSIEGQGHFFTIYFIYFLGLTGVRLHDGPDLKLFILVGWDRSFRLLLGPPGLN